MKGVFSLKELGKIIINVTKDGFNHYTFDIRNDNDDLSCITDVLEDTLKKY